MVTAVDRGRYTCLVIDGEPGTGKASYPIDANPNGHTRTGLATHGSGTARTVTAMRAKELRRQPVVVGDDVDLVGDTSGAKDTLARIVRVADRRSVLRRSADDTDPSERVIVANAAALMIVVAAADPPPRTGFMDRCLVAAYTGHLDAVILVTKTDLADGAEIEDVYRDLDVPILRCGRALGAAHDDAELDGAALEAVRDALTGQATALIGHSGVGKSTLVNALVPDSTRATGTVTGVGKGRHTSSSAIALALPGGGWIIDTPGVRSFGLAHVTPDDLLESFDDLLLTSARCPPGCSHARPGIGCALDDLVARGGASKGRLASFRRLLASRASDG